MAAQVEHVAERDEPDADDRQHRFLISMGHGKRAAHEGQPGHRGHERRGAAMAQGTYADGNRGDNHSQRQARFVDNRLGEQPSADAKRGDQN